MRVKAVAGGGSKQIVLYINSINVEIVIVKGKIHSHGCCNMWSKSADTLKKHLNYASGTDIEDLIGKIEHWPKKGGVGGLSEDVYQRYVDEVNELILTFFKRIYIYVFHT